MKKIFLILFILGFTTNYFNKGISKIYEPHLPLYNYKTNVDTELNFESDITFFPSHENNLTYRFCFGYTCYKIPIKNEIKLFFQLFESMYFYFKVVANDMIYM